MVGGAGVKEFGTICGVGGCGRRGGKDDGFWVPAGGDGGWFFLSGGVLDVGIFEAALPALNVGGWQRLIMSVY